MLSTLLAATLAIWGREMKGRKTGDSRDTFLKRIRCSSICCSAVVCQEDFVSKEKDEILR